jgi:hypothetical protein
VTAVEEERTRSTKNAAAVNLSPQTQSARLTAGADLLKDLEPLTGLEPVNC